MTDRPTPPPETWQPLDDRPGKLWQALLAAAEHHTGAAGLDAPACAESYAHSLTALLAALSPPTMARLAADVGALGEPAALRRAQAEREDFEHLIHPAAAAVMRAASARFPGRELSWLLLWREDGRYGAPRLIMRGSARRCLIAPPFPGTLAIHTHSAGDLEPSELDLQSAGKWVGVPGAGTAVMDEHCTRLYVVVPPDSDRPVPADRNATAPPTDRLPGEEGHHADG